ncbi:hypothetical protein BVRB_023110 [Beta vulgaris subsp. vulgaris]|uniref:Uncharacterized protein n=1 Tax=Beta vulgaris subsp. vulgaris TaxID=3555 RepID=A0A0J8AZS6_BETVV|nr:hypothetical protein BVRB_023110 [Beta vulgaris subsp. vulgaris]
MMLQIPRRLQLDLQLMEVGVLIDNLNRNLNVLQNDKVEKQRENPARSITIDLDKIEKNARLVRARDASKKKNKKSTSDLPSAAFSDSGQQQRLARPGSAPSRRPNPPGQAMPAASSQLQTRALVRPETGVRRQIRGSFG